MDYKQIPASALNSNPANTQVQGTSRQQTAEELRKQAEKLRDEGQCAAEFWLAEQYEISALLMS